MIGDRLVVDRAHVYQHASRIDDVHVRRGTRLVQPSEIAFGIQQYSGWVGLAIVGQLVGFQSRDEATVSQIAPLSVADFCKACMLPVA